MAGQNNNNNNNQFNWSNVATAGAGGVLGMIGNVIGNNRAYQQQQNLMNLQFQNQQALNQQAHDLGKDMWDYTNYENQAQHMRNAGLNIGLMYGGGGGGGSTTSQPSGGGASGGNAPMPINVMEMMNQMQMTKANIELAQANAEKARAEAKRISEGKGSESDASIDLKTQQTLVEQGNYNLIAENIKNAKAQNDILVSQGKITESDAKIRDEKNRAEVNLLVADKLLKESGIKVNDASIYKMAADVMQNAQRIAIEKQNADTNEKRLAIEQFRADTERLFPSMDKVMGGQAQKAANLSENLLKKAFELVGVNYDDWFKSK